MQRQWLHSKWMILIGLLVLVLATAVFWQSGARAQGREGAATVPDGPTADCATDDSYEDNDSFADAALVTPGNYDSLIICAADDWDYYKVNVPAGHTLHAELLFTHSSGDIDLHLYDQNENWIASSSSVTDNEAAHMTIAINDYYYVKVTFTPTSGNNLYTLNVALSCQECIMYQGQLMDEGNPANGEYQFQFRLYDAVGEIKAGPITRTVPVTNGLFTAELYFGETAVGYDTYNAVEFNGASYVDIQVRPAGSSDAFTPLTPRQPLTPAPVAHTLRPGALISGTTVALSYDNAALTVNNKDEAGIYISAGHTGVGIAAGWDGVRIGSAGWDGLLIDSAGEDGVAIGSAGDDGVDIDSAGGTGVSIGSAGDDGVYVDSAGADGVSIGSAGDDGVYVDSAGADGVFISSAGRDGVNISSAVRDGVNIYSVYDDGIDINSADAHGVNINSAGRNGVNIDSAAEDGLRVCTTGSETLCSTSPYNHGVEIGNAENDGLHVTEAGGDGLEVCATGTQSSCTANSNDHGVEVGNAEHDGLHIINAGRDGLDVENAGADGVLVRNATDWAADFNGSINVSGSCTGCSTALMGVNKSEQPLQPGDLVASQQTAVGNQVGQQILVDVGPAVAGQGVIGVVQGRAELVATDRDDGTTGAKLVPRDGVAQSGDYVTIIIYGLAQVPIDPASEITPNQQLTVGENGLARPLQTGTVTTDDGRSLSVAEDAPTVGLVLDSKPNDDGMIWILVNPQ